MNLLLVTYRLKSNMKLEKSNLEYFYEHDFMKNDHLQSISKTLSDLSHSDLSDFIVYTFSNTLKEISLS